MCVSAARKTHTVLFSGSRRCTSVFSGHSAWCSLAHQLPGGTFPSRLKVSMTSGFLNNPRAADKVILVFSARRDLIPSVSGPHPPAPPAALDTQGNGRLLVHLSFSVPFSPAQWLQIPNERCNREIFYLILVHIRRSIHQYRLWLVKRPLNSFHFPKYIGL